MMRLCRLRRQHSNSPKSERQLNNFPVQAGSTGAQAKVDFDGFAPQGALVSFDRSLLCSVTSTPLEAPSMDPKAIILNRVRQDAEALSVALKGSNAPIEKYIDVVDADALTDALGLPADHWKFDDLGRILIIRDGLYAARNMLRDQSEAGEHSVDQILAATDRLYADLERALRELGPNELPVAQSSLSEMQKGPNLESWRAKDATSALRTQANEVLVESHTTNTRIEVNLFRFDNINLELLRSAKLSVQRFSASVFAIKISLEQSIIFQGVFQFLHENADRILNDIRKTVDELKQAYQHTREVVSDLGRLADIGARFSRLVADFLRKAFIDSSDQPSDPIVKFVGLRNYDSEAISAFTQLNSKLFVGGGKYGVIYIADISAGKIYDQKLNARADVLSIAAIDDQRVAVGTAEGLDIIALNRALDTLKANVREPVAALTTTRWGGRGLAVVTGSREGLLRRWSLAGGVTAYRLAGSTRDIVARAGRGLVKVVTIDDLIVAASGQELLILDSNLDIKRRIGVQFTINDVAIRDKDSMLVCGLGSLAHVNLTGGTYSRLLASSSGQNYTAITCLSDRFFCAGTSAGRVTAVSFDSGVELGTIELNMEIRGLIQHEEHVLVFGGNWKQKSRSCQIIRWSST